jgi:hypothetical protein
LTLGLPAHQGDGCVLTLHALPTECNQVELNFLNWKLKALTVYFGSFCKQQQPSRE